MRATPSDRGRDGWTTFAAVMLLIVGVLDLAWGLAAILNSEVVRVGGHGVLLGGITTWGWVTLLLGVALALTGLGLLAGISSARWAAVFLVGVGAMLQLAWFSAAPLWCVLIIALSFVLVYHLMVPLYDEGSP